MSTNQYSYISYSPPPTDADSSALRAVTRQHVPMASTVIPDIDLRRWRSELSFPAVPPPTAAGRDEQIFAVLSHDAYRKGPLDYFNDARATIQPRLDTAISTESPIEMVLPSFPGRPVSLLRHTRQQPDLGEAASLARLWHLDRAVRRVYPPGLRWIIVMDGMAYAPFYGYPTPPFGCYQSDLRAMAARMGVADSFRFVDLASLVAERKSEFDRIHPEATAEVSATWRRGDYRHREELVEAMKLGANTASADAAAVQAITFPATETGDHSADLAEAVRQRAEHTAFEYVCFLVTLRRLDLFRRRFPNAVRATVHPKPGQYSPHLVNDRTTIVPWHGVAVREPDGTVRSVYESQLLADPRRHRAVFLAGEYTPFYYQNIEN